MSPGSNNGRQRPRSRGFSFNSNKSGGSRPKSEFETPEEKQRRDSIWKNQSKSNPNAAMTEAQPGDAYLVEQATLESLREGQHKDVNGNVITDPDLSNPTRPRLERPLDTIRSFEKAIDNGYKRRSSMVRGESYEQGQSQGGANYHSRSSSYFGGYDPNASNSGRYSQNGGYHGGRTPSYNDGSRPMRGGYGNRMNSDGGRGGNGFYPQHGYHQSHDTVGSDSTGPWANSTDPSSENSSLDRINATSKPSPDGYGYNNYSSGPIPEDGAYAPPRGYGGPVQSPGGERKPIPLGNTTGESPVAAPPRGDLPSTARPPPEKRKSWLKRTFSKKE